MTRALPSLEEPAPGTHCPRCNRPVRLAAPLFCAPCFDLTPRLCPTCLRHPAACVCGDAGETPMTAQQWAQQEARIDTEVEEYHERKGRFAFDAGDDPFPERSAK